MKKIILSISVFVFSLFLVGCEAKLPTLEVSDVRLCDNLGYDKLCVQDIEVFDDATNEIFLTARVNNANQPGKIIVYWSYESQASYRIMDQQIIPKKSNDKFVSSYIRPNNGWQKGEHTIVIKVINEKYNTQDYIIRKNFKIVE